MIEWQSLGLHEDDFWRKTLRQIAQTFEAYGRKFRREHNGRAWLAWHIAALHRISTKKKLPALRSLMIREQKRAPQPWQQQLAIAKQWVTMMGGSIRNQKEGG